MNRIYVLKKWQYDYRVAQLKSEGLDYQVIDTTSGSGDFSDLSPFILGPCMTYIGGIYARRFENLWQYSKVYKEYIQEGYPSLRWYAWRDRGWSNPLAVRYPMGKGAKPEYLYWNSNKMGYVDARKKVYAPEYARNVAVTGAYKRLKKLFEEKNLILLDYDAYDRELVGYSLKDVINNPDRKCGHAFVLAMMLTGELEGCLI